MTTTIKPSWRILWPAALWILPGSFLVLFYVYPLAAIFAESFRRGETLLSPIVDTLNSASARGVIWFTIYQAVLSTGLTLALGLPGAYLFGRFTFPGKSLLRALTGVPFVLPTLVVAAAFNALLGPSGWVNAGLMAVFSLERPPITFINSLSAILVAHVFYNTTIVLRMVGDYWSNLNPRLEAAARVLGAGPFQVLSRITIPALSPAIAAAVLLVFIFNFTSFGVILVLGGPRFATIEVEVYTQTIGFFNLPAAASLSLIQLAFTLALTVIYTRLSRRINRPVDLRARSFTQRPLVGLGQRLWAALFIGVLLAVLVAPLLGLAARSFTRLTPERGQQTPSSVGLTLDFYKELSVNRRESLFFVPPMTAVATSLGYALATVILALIVGAPAAWALARDPEGAISRWLDPFLMLPLGTSAVTLGLGFILALDQPPLDLRASPVLIPVAHTLVAFPFVVRSLAPALRSIPPRLRESAAVLGASPWRTLQHVDLPLVGRALLVAATFAFTISLGEFGATALIARPEFPTIPVMIFRFLSQPGALNYGQALALSTILMLVTATGMLAIERLRIARVGEF